MYSSQLQPKYVSTVFNSAFVFHLCMTWTSDNTSLRINKLDTDRSHKYTKLSQNKRSSRSVFFVSINKNFAIANIARQLRTQYVEGIYKPKYYTVTLKCRLRVTQGHCKRNQLFDVECIIVTLKCGLEVTQDTKWYHLKAWVQFSTRLP